MSNGSVTPNLHFAEIGDADNQEDFPATRKEVQNYVQNAFIVWHKPTSDQVNKLDALMDIMFMYGTEVGFEIKEGRAYMDPKVIIAWATEKQKEKQLATQAAVAPQA